MIIYLIGGPKQAEIGVHPRLKLALTEANGERRTPKVRQPIKRKSC